jgi:tetratricopeptide (TPR) repeat protein
LSKLSQLKQEAYQAGKKKNWDQAIALYEQILEKDKNNPTLINELGDLCLKAGDTSRSVRHFLNAAAKYRATGLLNNAVAIYKKILRYDAKNANAHWYLAETRAGQGLTVEGESHALEVLDSSEQATGDIREIFLKRCSQLFELLPESRGVQERLVETFRVWEMHLEAARAQCLVAAVDHAAGKADEAAKLVEQATAKSPEVRNYPEFQKWNLLVNPQAAPAAQFSDFGAVDLSGAAAADAPEATTDAGDGLSAAVDEDESASGVEIPETDIPEAGTSDDGVPEHEIPEVEIPEVEIPAAPEPASGEDGPGIRARFDPTGPEKDDDGCFSIDGDGGDLDELIAAATGRRAESADAAVVDEQPAAPRPETERPAGGGLLDQLLSESDEASPHDKSELETITSEIGSVVGGAGGDDAARLYEMGTVYLEMGLYDQAAESFETASCDEEYTVRAREMWGITLQRAGRLDEAIRVLSEGIEHAAEGSREEHGLRYHLGRAHEQAGAMDEAAECYRAIKAADPTFLDVNRRLKSLVSV